jgi:threonine/homoserine/homoserine lactone efflux protein
VRVQYLVLGLSLGVGAGLAPGPLLALVITTALSRGFGAAAKVACVPLVSDVVTVTAALLVVRSLPSWVVGVLGMAGGAFVVWLGVEALREQPAEVEDTAPDGSFRRGVLVNLLSPHPWLFWITVGAPIIVAAWAASPPYAVAFLASFLAVLVGTKVVIAAVVSGGRRRLSPRSLRRAHVLSAALLLLTGVLLVAEFARTLLP